MFCASFIIQESDPRVYELKQCRQNTSNAMPRLCVSVLFRHRGGAGHAAPVGSGVQGRFSRGNQSELCGRLQRSGRSCPGETGREEQRRPLQGSPARLVCCPFHSNICLSASYHVQQFNERNEQKVSPFCLRWFNSNINNTVPGSTLVIQHGGSFPNCIIFFSPCTACAICGEI